MAPSCLRIIEHTDSDYRQRIDALLALLRGGGLLSAQDDAGLDVPAIVADILSQVREGGAIRSFVKLLKRRADNWLVLEQFNPAGQIKMASNTVKAIHKVLNSNEMFGNTRSIARIS